MAFTRTDPLTMRDIRVDYPDGPGTGAVTGRLVGWTPSARVPTDLIFARQALDRQQFADAERHLRRALDSQPESAEAQTLMGVLHERLGEIHAAYRCYKHALKVDPYSLIARAGLRRYCKRFGFDIRRPTINPPFDEPAHG
jgi:hypothetical protein